VPWSKLRACCNGCASSPYQRLREQIQQQSSPFSIQNLKPSKLRFILISTDTQWNGRNILDGSLGEVDFQVGANASQTISITFADLNTDFGATEASQAGIDGSTSADLDIFTNLNVTAAGTTSGDETIDLASPGDNR